MMDRQVTELREQGHAESAAATAARMALWEAEIGDRMSARQYSALSRKLFRGRSNSILIALALTLAGDGQNGKSITDELEKRFPVDTTVRQVAVPLTKALVEMDGQHPETAIVDLEPTVRYENGTMGGLEILYVRGLAHLKNRQWDEAASTFRRIIEHRGMYPEAPEWLLAHLGLARAYAMQLDAHQTKDASNKTHSAYQAFLTLCKQADPNFPPLQEGKAEYAKLQMGPP
jgi:hypothetical protein